MTVRRILTIQKGTIYSTDYAPAARDVFLVADLRRRCRNCGKWPAGVSAQSKKKARRALDRMRACPCSKSQET